MRRNWLVAATVVGIVAIVIAVVIFRLADDDSRSVETTAWADSVCTSLSDWRSSITSLADASGGELTPGSLGAKLDAAQDATSQLISELQDIGPPGLDAGDDLKQELDTSVVGLRLHFEALKQGAREAAQAGPTHFLRKLAALAPEFQALLDAISTTVDDLRNANVAEDAKAELQQAFEDAESCRELRELS